MGFAKSRVQARQMVGHGLFSVNGKKVDIPSYQVRPADLITVSATKTAKKAFARSRTA